jgi:F-type H+-transporting ATPase subunit b
VKLPSMRRATLVRALMLSVMVGVTAWSMWATAQQGRPPPHGMPGGMPPRGGMGGMPPHGGMGGMPGMMPPHGGAGMQAPSPASTPEPPRPPKPPVKVEKVEKSPEAEEAEEAAEANKPPADINWIDFGRDNPPYLAMVINFAILMFGFYHFGRKPVAAALKSRRDTIARDIEEAQRMRKEAEKRAKKYQAKLANLEQEMKDTRIALVSAGEVERERIVAEAEAKAERMRKDALFQVEQELKQLKVDLQRDTVEVAIAAAEELLRKRVTPADQERLAEDYLLDLAKSPAAKTATKTAGGPS